ncbi:MAG: hypothetical protein JST54_29225 [Deltaproteobacteria bacterium]|nr:hypothetical protein [Deltaproteobacteria bacterium]
MVFVPSLAATLGAVETKNGRPLTREELEKLRDKSPCIAMKPRDAQEMERARGYADLDPELAWEQWQAYRANKD